MILHLLGHTCRSQFREWIAFQKKKWAYQLRQRSSSSSSSSVKRSKRGPLGGDGDGRDDDDAGIAFGVVRSGGRMGTLGGFLRRAQRTLLDTPWQIIQIVETGQPGKEMKIRYVNRDA